MSGMYVERDTDHVTIYETELCDEHGEPFEVMRWVGDEWIEDASVLDAITFYTQLAAANPAELRERFWWRYRGIDMEGLT